MSGCKGVEVSGRGEGSGESKLVGNGYGDENDEGIVNDAKFVKELKRNNTVRRRGGAEGVAQGVLTGHSSNIHSAICHHHQQLLWCHIRIKFVAAYSVRAPKVMQSLRLEKIQS